MRYRCSGVEKHLRIEWHHRPINESVETVVQCIRDYIKNPQDVMEFQKGETFKTLLPDYCIVLKGGHKTRTSKTARPPDTSYHISVRFGKLTNRAGPGPVWAHSVHIYLDENTKKYVPKQQVVWSNPTIDKDEHSAVYKNRTRWPAGATATTAPPAPGEQPLALAPSTLAPLPTTNPWGFPIIPSQPSNTP
ncbi:hypothetical protein I7I51_06180 [Histoplasma capsulatum]|uniref:Uncharacterized protein n=1 Tax=Ajellomyces capsulatus TaxID=5037 RepID=A0A8A1MFE2_AJECA|nr:hypothetical protein I7I51_06180 [Histoplasma capsulatum]